MAVQFDVITLFPEMFDAITKYGITQRAYSKGLYDLTLWNPRDFTQDVHHTVDDRPYGGGPGMVMMVDPLVAAVDAAKQKQMAVSSSQPWVVHFSPIGKRLDQQKAQALLAHDNLVLVTSRYEGVDQRFIDAYVDEELSIGDYVLSGGELPAMVLMDTMIRLLPGALGHENSALEDSFADGLLDCPHYTRPEEHELGSVPEILLSGHHEKIKQWRLKMSLKRTRDLRPDLLAEKLLTKEEARLLKALDEK